MKIKQIVFLLVGIIVALLGLLWFLQGMNIIHLRPILCFADCEPIIGKSMQWQITGAVTFVVGILIIGKNIARIKQKN
jgi:hypothetical protein